MLRQIFSLMDRKFVSRMFWLLTIQQVLVALGTAVLALAGKNLGSGHLFFVLTLGFFVLSIVPHGLSVRLKRLEMEGYLETYFTFLKQKLLCYEASPGLWQNHHQKEKFLTAIGPDGETYLTACCFSVFDLYLFFLAIVLNIASIAIVLDWRMLIIFSVSGGLSFFVFKHSERSIDHAVALEQNHKIGFFSYLLKSWDNVLLRNEKVNRLYTHQLSQRLAETKTATGVVAVKTEGMVFHLTCVASAPVFLALLWLSYQNSGNVAYLAGLLVTIPKQLNILVSFRSFFQQTANLQMFRKRFENCCAVARLEIVPLSSRINLPALTFNGIQHASLQALELQLNEMRVGRVTVRGANGSGKSTLLLHLNETIKNSIYLPASPQLEIGVEFGGESTGERMLKYLDFFARQNAPVVLLDEWDANLDSANRFRVSERISALAQSKIVIEIRHGSGVTIQSAIGSDLTVNATVGS